jgi:hypothetical protein
MTIRGVFWGFEFPQSAIREQNGMISGHANIAGVNKEDLHSDSA